jgi:hypothetical protein
MNPRDPQLQKLGKILEQSLKRLDPSGRISEYGIWPIWNETVGSLIARNAQPEKIRNGTLFVSVSSSTWMQQLQYMKEMIAQKLNERLGREIVRTIFFVLGKRDEKEHKIPVKKSPAQPRSRTARPIDEAQLRSIKDPQIRQAFRKLFDNCSRSEKPK